jgi:quinolinate synthase
VKKTGREMLLWQGTCSVHEQFSGTKIRQLKLEHPDALVLAHPECEDAILDMADHIGSTSALLAFVRTSPAHTFIVATEVGILHQMELACPDKTVIAAPPESSCACNECPYMKLNTMEKLYLCLRDGTPEITLPDGLMSQARRSIERMMRFSSTVPGEAEDVLAGIHLPFTLQGRASAQ